MSTNHLVYLFLVDVDGDDELQEADSFNGIPSKNHVLETEQGDTIEWLLGNNSRINSIQNITAQEDILFAYTPTQEHQNPSVWHSQINSNAPVSSPVNPLTDPYSYTIKVLPDGGGNAQNVKVKCYDPKIKVNIGVHKLAENQ